MDNKEREQLAQSIALALEKRRTIPESDHRQHHELISEWLETRKRRREVLQQWVVKPALGFLTITLLGSLLSFLAFIADLVIKYLQHKGG